ncbi:MAG TPA: NfeD family protein [Dehalococcoidia bacterium]|nr:NfeD family protein [Dehalococcoidia bacterium]
MSVDQAFFLAIALFGALFLFVSFVLGSVGDFFDSVGDSIGEQLDFGGGDGDATASAEAGAGDEGPSPLSLRNLMAFMTAYGASGMITSSYGWSTLASSLFALLPGFSLAFVAYKFLQLLYGQQSNSVTEVGSLIGRTGVVEVSIPPSGLGRVTVGAAGGANTFIARAEGGAHIPAGERVVIRAVLGSDLVVARTPEVIAEAAKEVQQ